MTGINPFSTRFVRPGAQPFLYPPDWNRDRLTQILGRHGWWGEVVGPHGSGKSTLVHDLIACLQQQNRRVIHLTLSSRDRRWPASATAGAPWDENTQLIVDGYEQLGRWQRWRIQRQCRRRGSGLLVTSHRSMGLPRLWTTEPALKTTQELVAALRQHSACVEIDDDLVRDLYQRHDGNIRELLFDLYDVYERQVRSRG